MTRPQLAALSKELDAAASLLAHGVRILQSDGYSVLDAPAVLACLAIGAEKLLKLTIGMVAIEETGFWPNKKTMAERYRHAILALDRHARAAITRRIDNSGAPGYIRELLSSVQNDVVIGPVLEALDNYAPGPLLQPGHAGRCTTGRPIAFRTLARRHGDQDPAGRYVAA
jgi:hypothetical protein